MAAEEGSQMVLSPAALLPGDMEPPCLVKLPPTSGCRQTAGLHPQEWLSVAQPGGSSAQGSLFQPRRPVSSSLSGVTTLAPLMSSNK